MSKKLDDELARAVQALDARTRDRDEDSALEHPAEAARPRGKSNLGLLVGLLVAGAALAALFVFGFGGASRYSASVDVILAQKDKLAGRPLRVEGHLVNGTLEKREKPCEYRFVMKDPEKDTRLPVSFAHCTIPDTFRDVAGVEVTVEGKLTSEGKLEATNIMAKCTSKYDPKTHSMGSAEPASAGPKAPTPIVD